MSIEPSKDAATLNEHGYRLWLAGTLQKLMTDKGMTERDLAERAQLPVSHVRRVLHGELTKDVNLRTIVRLSNALDVQIRMTLAVPVPPVTGEQLIPYAVQLRQGMVVHISLPADFSDSDVYRLFNFMNTLPLPRPKRPI